MSQQQENGAPPRPQSTSHSEQPSYPSPPMQPSYAYPPPQGQASNEPYRQSPSGSNMPILPPIRGMDGQSQPSAQPPPPQGAQPLPPGQPMAAYPYAPPPGQPIMPGQVAPYPPQRYALPAQNADARMMSGGRHKKEIKRRTKTGCLTCRKRRIKCDEQHPKCRNCIKSKRECLGYDPIFKQQQAPSQLQPAPNASPSSSASIPTTAATPGYPPSSGPYQPVSNGTSAPSTTSAGIKPETSQPYEFGSAIDPALAGGPGAMASYGGPQFRPPPTVPCKVEDLWYFQGHRPTDIPPQPQPLPQELMDEIRELFMREFAPGCDSIMETDWFSKSGADVLMSSAELCAMMAELIKHYKYVGTGQNFAVENKCRVFETMATWKLLSLCRQPSIKIETKSEHGTNGTTSSTLTPELTREELTKRLEAIEALLTNATLSANPLASLKYPDSLPQPKVRQIDFWRQAGVSATISPDDTSGQAVAPLSAARNVLDMYENRDVLYSIMVCRHLGRQFQGFPDHLQSGRLEGGELDDRNKVVIAHDFIMNEGNWKGTTHPIQRVCDMAVRSWSVRPGQRP